MSASLWNGAVAAALAGAISGWVCPAATGAPLAWLDFDGAIPGGATEPPHAGWIEIRGFDFSSSRAIDLGGGGTGGVWQPGVPVLAEIGLTKTIDQASPRLFLAAVGGSGPFDVVTLDLSGNAGQPFVRVELENVLISGQRSAAARGGPAEETVSLNFTKLTYTYIQPDLGTNFASYDVRTNHAESGTTPPPEDADSDADGMPDAWETAYGLAVGTNDAGGDADGDGLTNLHEYQLGTNPRSGTSFFQARLSLPAAQPGTCDLTWNSVVGKTYVIEWSPDLATPFSPVKTVTASATETTENLTRSGPLGFYRVRPQ